MLDSLGDYLHPKKEQDLSISLLRKKTLSSRLTNGMVDKQGIHFKTCQCDNIILCFILSGSILYTMNESYLRVGATLFHCLFMYTIGMTAIISSNTFFILCLLIFYDRCKICLLHI